MPKTTTFLSKALPPADDEAVGLRESFSDDGYDRPYAYAVVEVEDGVGPMWLQVDDDDDSYHGHEDDGGDADVLLP